MILQTSNGPKEYVTKDLDFTNVMCDLEDNGVDVMALLDKEQRKNMKVFSTMRAVLAAVVGISDLQIAGKMFTEHLKNGGEMDEVMNAFVGAMESAGFGESAETEKPQTEGTKEEQSPVKK